MADQVRCLPLVSTIDGPVFTAKPGTLTELTNMTLQPGGFAEARGGLSTLKPNGGTATDFISAGGHSCVHELSSTFGWIRTYDKTNNLFSDNLALDAGGYRPFVALAVDDAIYWGSDVPFSRVGLYLATAAAYVAATFAYEYWNGSAWTALTTTETISWIGSTYQYASWNLPAGWAPTSIGDSGTGNVYRYWMRCRVVTINTPTQYAVIFYSFAYWAGSRDVFVAGQNPLASAITGTLKRYGRSGTTGEAFSVSAALFSGAASPTRIVSYRGRIFLVNGKDAKRYDGANLSDIGLPEGTWVGAGAVSSNVPLPVGDPFFDPATPTAGALPAGTYRWYVAWGYGFATDPSQNRYAGALPQGDVAPMYGYGRAHYIGELTIGAPAIINFNFSVVSTIVPADAGAYAMYRTQDLTNVPLDKRASFPAFMIWSYARSNNLTTAISTSFGTSIPTDNGGSAIYPPIEMYNYDVAPPTRPRFAVVHQNRLLLGTDDTWYWSDPFVPDRFRKYVSYISLAKSSGGRHMGGAEYGDQAVLYTEDQTWGLTNIDLDVPNLFPIHPGVGCIAPDSVATGDGVIVWAARDGIYMWDGGRAAPKKVSWNWNETFGKMSYETHGGSRGVIHNYHYDIRLASPDYTTTQGLFRLNLLTMEWSTISHNAAIVEPLYPLGPIHGPLGSEDPGMLHPVYGKGDYSATGAYHLYLGEMTTADAGNGYVCSGTAHFPLAPGEVFVPERALAYYSADAGWGTPVFSFATAAVIGDPAGTMTTGTPDTGTDYSVVGGTFAQAATGTSDLKVKFSVTTASGGTVGHQRLYGFVLEGRKKIRVRA